MPKLEDALDARRLALGLSAVALCRRAGITTQTWYAIRRGGGARADTLHRLAFALGLDADLLVRTQPEPRSATQEALDQVRDLLSPGGLEDPGEFVAAVNLLWRATFLTPDPPEV